MFVLTRSVYFWPLFKLTREFGYGLVTMGCKLKDFNMSKYTNYGSK